MTRVERIAAAMELCGVVRTDDVSFGRPRLKGTGLAVHNLWDRFRAGETIRSIAADFAILPSHVENAIRFCSLYPKSDLPSFWRTPRRSGR